MNDFLRTVRRAAQLALGRLGWTVEAFWAATPVELATAMQGTRLTDEAGGPGKLLEQLMKEFPDE